MLLNYTGKEEATDRDNFKYKRIELVGSLIYDLFREYYSMQQRTIQLEFEKIAHYNQSLYANNLFGLVKFYKLARSSGLKPIMGADVLIKYSNSKKPTNMTLLIKNEIGYRNLTKLISDAYLSKHTNAVPVIDFSWLKTLNTGLIAL